MSKYVIELPENTHWIQWIMESTKDHHPYMDYKQVEYLTPYTEPDMEKVRKEAYTEAKIDAGQEYENGYDAGHNVGYQQGLSDAWEAAQKIANMPYGEEEKAFGSGGWSFINKHTASEAIEKIRQYEQEQKQEEEQIQVGDEVEGDEDGQRGVVIDSRFENSQVAVLTGNSKVYSWWSKCAIHKTGRHFPEIAEVMRKMKEDS